MLGEPPQRYFSPEPTASAANKRISSRQTIDRNDHHVHMDVAAVTTKEHDRRNYRRQGRIRQHAYCPGGTSAETTGKGGRVLPSRNAV